ncbi:hypothetical protein NQ317_004459 [Molorchus minor]|uniref:Uncharacterized protein n=1 Tax=Molorchus minor TaxID=1323400 RepID=A0ABQ9JMJ4_9CUCU|nr:hypothetical protein NQ317_004459 [Molorchus minor]
MRTFLGSTLSQRDVLGISLTCTSTSGIRGLNKDILRTDSQTAHNIHWTSILHPKLIRTSMDLSKGQGKLSRSCPNNISINSHKKHGGWNEKMAETGQEEGYVLDLKWMSIIHTYFVLLCTKLDIHYM